MLVPNFYVSPAGIFSVHYSELIKKEYKNKNNKSQWKKKPTNLLAECVHRSQEKY